MLLGSTLLFSAVACNTSEGTTTTSSADTNLSTSAGETEDTTESNTGGEARTITALVQQSRNFDGLQEMMAKLQTDENITVDVQVVPDDESLNMIKMKLNSGEAPDIIDYNVPAIYDIIDPEANFADMSEEDWVQKLRIPANVTHSDGKIYGFPFSVR